MLQDSDLGEVTAYMSGPARILWERSFPGVILESNFSSVLEKTNTVITGTGWSSDVEHVARLEARMRGIYSIAVLDHWINYVERFVRDGKALFPDEIWVVDEYALKLAHGSFPTQKIRIFPDSYANRLVRTVAPISSIIGNSLLYLLEPIRSDWGRGELGEFQALKYFLKRLPQLGLPEDTVIKLRPHPSDVTGKYDSFLTTQGPYKVFLATDELSRELSNARWAAGCQTYAMTLAIKAGRMVFCSLPPWAPECVLPHEGVIHVKNWSAT